MPNRRIPATKRDLLLWQANKIIFGFPSNVQSDDRPKPRQRQQARQVNSQPLFVSKDDEEKRWIGPC